MKTKTTKSTLCLFLIVALFSQISCRQSPKSKQQSKQQEEQTVVPTLDELAADWMEVSTLRNLPSINNFYGGLKVTKDISSIEFLTFPPYSQGGNTGKTLINGKQVDAQESRWYPYQVKRKSAQNNLDIESVTRMVFEKQGVLFHLDISNKLDKQQTVKLNLELLGRIRKFEGRWDWDSPRPNDGAFTSEAKEDNSMLLIRDKESPTITLYCFVQKPDKLTAKNEKGIVEWNLTIPPGKSISIDYVMAVSEKENINSAELWAKSFDRKFDDAKMLWEKRWQDVFTPNNNHYSGHLPTLETDDNKLRRVYYMGIASNLQLQRTNLPVFDRVTVTAGPQWAVTLMYFWDAEMWANIWAMLEPKEMKDIMKGWFKLDLHNCYARDYFSGQSSGPWYAANDISIFTCIDSYIRVTGDTAFLSERSENITMLQHLKNLATQYRSLVAKGEILADYGESYNLLECVPTYIHKIPSFNASNIFMLRRTAEYYRLTGEPEQAKQLEAEANKLLPEVMKLYVPQQGVWSSLHHDGKKVEMRHVFDFIMIGRALANDLNAGTKSEMIDFVKSELLTKNWMRAQSLKDVAAANSDRPDHGPMGSYDGWPPLTMDVMCRFGDFEDAFSFLHRTEEVTHEGPFSQSHELLGRDNNATIRIANRGGQDFNEVCGTAFSDVIITAFFGFEPQTKGNFKILEPGKVRGFNGVLKNIPYHNAEYNLVSDDKGIHIKQE